MNRTFKMISGLMATALFAVSCGGATNESADTTPVTPSAETAAAASPDVIPEPTPTATATATPTLEPTPAPEPDQEATTAVGAGVAREVSIETQGYQTAATFIAASSEPGPAVVLVAGSGPTDRNGDSQMEPREIGTLKFVAEQLASAGISSVRFDKLGVGSSDAPTDPAAVTFTDFVEQAADVRAWLAAQPETDPERISLVGHSEGALIVLKLAVAEAPESIALLAPLSNRYFDTIRSQIESQVTADQLAEYDQVVAQLRTDGSLINPIADPAIATVFPPYLLAFLIDADASDPLALAPMLSAETAVLLVCGSVDVQVPCDSTKMLRDEFTPGQLTFVQAEGVNHVLRESGTDGGLATYTDASLPHSGLVASAVVDLVKG